MRPILFLLVLGMAYAGASAGAMAAGPPTGVPGLGTCKAPTLASSAERCEVAVFARHLTADEAGVGIGIGQTRVESLEEGFFIHISPKCEGAPLCPVLFHKYRVRVVVGRLGLTYTWLLHPPPSGGHLEGVEG